MGEISGKSLPRGPNDDEGSIPAPDDDDEDDDEEVERGRVADSDLFSAAMMMWPESSLVSAGAYSSSSS